MGFESYKSLNIVIVLEKIYKLRYFLLIGFFLVWMVFIDSNNLFYRLSIYNDIRELEKQKAYYTVQTAKLSKERSELFGNLRNLERFAREKYLMKKDQEDLFIIVRDSSEVNQ